MGLLERHIQKKGSRVKVKHVANARRETVQGEIFQHVQPGSQVFTDSLPSYEKLGLDYIHQAINHAECYVKGNVHTNGMENFWSLLKRAIKGTYVSVEPFHLTRYLDEEAFRFNQRAANDADRFLTVAKSVTGKRLTYEGLINSQVPV
jgi:transposase-like protein